MKGVCLIAKCQNRARTRGLCQGCYERARRNGDLHIHAPFTTVGSASLEVAIAAYTHELVFRSCARLSDINEFLGKAPYHARRAAASLRNRGIANVRQGVISFTDLGLQWLDVMLRALPPGEKRCSRCGLTKPLEEFNRNYRTRDGRRQECRSCRKTRLVELDRSYSTDLQQTGTDG